MGELVYNLFVYATNNEIKALGVATHRIGGNDDEKIAHLQGAIGDDFQVATQYLLSKPLPWQQFELLMRLGRALELFESVLTEIHAQREPLVVITPVVDGAPRFDFVGGLAGIIHEGADFGRQTKASAWYKAVATRAFSHDGGF
jgi:hypothetical protein